MLKYLYATIIFAISMGLKGYSQQTCTPGGIPNASTALRFWLETADMNADNNATAAPANNSAVTFWKDKSGNAIHFSQPVTDAKPVYQSNFGGFPAILFDDVLGGTKHTLNPVTSQANLLNGSVYFVFTGKPIPASNTTWQSSILMEDKRLTAEGSLRYDQNNRTGRVGFTLYSISDYSTALVSPYNKRSVLSFSKQSGSALVKIRSQAAGAYIDIGSSTRTLPVGSLGTNNKTAPDYANGYFYEVLVFDNALDTVKAAILEHHLAAKYSSDTGVSLPVLNAAFYDGASAANGNYDFDVIGIGKTGASTHSLIANNSFGFSLATTNTSFPTNTFILMGHADGARAAGKSWVTAGINGVTSTTEQRFDRLWWVTHTGTTICPTTITFNFGQAKSTIVPSGDVCRYLLLKRNGVSWDIVKRADAVSGSSLIFDSVSLADGVYTVGQISSTFDNNIAESQSINCGVIPATITGNNPGATVSPAYQWQSSIDSVSWTNVAGATAQNYSPAALGTTTWYRRVVSPGASSTFSGCVNTSLPVKITVVSSNPANIVKLNNPANSVICYSTSPGNLLTNGTSLGTTAYTYQWYSKLNTGAWTPISAATAETYTPGLLTDTTSFRRVATSTTAPFCASTSNTILVQVKPAVERQGPILGAASACRNSGNNIYQIAATAGATYTWSYSGTGATIASGATTNEINVSYSSTATGGNWTVTMTINGCTSAASEAFPVSISTETSPSVTAVSNKVACGGTTVSAITFSGTTGTTYNWTNSNTSIGLAASGTGNIAAFIATTSGASPAVATITVTPSSTTTGCVGISTTFTITVNPKPAGSIAVDNSTICQGDALNLIFTATAGTGPFAIIINGTAPAYSVASGAPFAVPIPTTSTVYNLTSITDANSCTNP